MLKDDIPKHIIITILTLLSSYLLNNTVFENSKTRIDNTDFTVIESDLTIDSISQIRTFFISNNTSFPINNDNVKIVYISNTQAIKANFTNSNGEFINIRTLKNGKSIFQTSLPEKLKNEDFFTISVIYPYDAVIIDKLNIKIESKNDDKFLNLPNDKKTISQYIDQSSSSYYFCKTVIVIESGIIIYAILIFLANFLNSLWSMHKEKQDKELFTNRNSNKFLKKK